MASGGNMVHLKYTMVLIIVFILFSYASRYSNFDFIMEQEHVFTIVHYCIIESFFVVFF